MNPNAYIEALKKRGVESKAQGIQSTMHQQDAVETAEMLNDIKSIGIYLKLFKNYHRHGLISCRDWVMTKKFREPGRVFVKTFHRKFKN